jgi:hypothetical protein
MRHHGVFASAPWYFSRHREVDYFADVTMTNTWEQMCTGCGRPNGCAVAAGRSATACWCMGSTTRLPVPEEEIACYCETCLRAIDGRIDAGSVLPDAN